MNCTYCTYCTYCNSELKQRIYTFNEIDDDGNMYCTNENCSTNVNNDVAIKNKSYKIKYCCKTCGRTLLYNNKNIFGNCDLVDGWLSLSDYGINNYCDDCENYVLNLNNYSTCEICGKVCKNNVCSNNHKIILNNIKCTVGEFIKNPSCDKCIYCNKYLMKCSMCDNSCYVCVFEECRKSQLNGLTINYYSYLCKTHSLTVTNNWTRNNFVKTSNIVCDDCGTNESHYTPNCKCLNVKTILICINCRDVDYAMYATYCYACS